jgi:hypothetical protein
MARMPSIWWWMRIMSSMSLMTGVAYVWPSANSVCSDVVVMFAQLFSGSMAMTSAVPVAVRSQRSLRRLPTRGVLLYRAMSSGFSSTRIST